MIESSKSGKSIWCSVAINNRLETSRHWWNLRPFLCGGLSAVAMHVNNAWSQIDSSSLSSPSTHWLPSLQAGAALFPSSDWLCLEGSGGDGKSPAPFSHAVLAALAPHCSDLCVCCWHSTLGPLVNFSWDPVAQSCHLDTYYRPRLFWKVNLLHCTPKVLLLFFSPPLFSPRRAGIVIGSNAVSQFCHNNSCCFCFFLDVSHSSHPPPSFYPPSSFSLSFFFFFFFSFLSFSFLFFEFSVTHWRMVLVWEATATFSTIQPWEPRGLSASSHPGVSVGSPLKLGTLSSPPWSESQATAPHNPYSKGQLDWNHSALGEQRDLPPPPTSHSPVTEYLRQLWHVKIETGLNSRHLAPAL